MILFNQLPQEDLKKIENYAKRFSFTDFNIGVEGFLHEWDKQKRLLYKLLGNKLTYEFSFEAGYNDSNSLGEEYSKILDKIIRCELLSDLRREVQHAVKVIKCSPYSHESDFDQSLKFFVDFYGDFCSEGITILASLLRDNKFHFYFDRYRDRTLFDVEGKKIAVINPDMRIAKVIKKYIDILVKFYGADKETLLKDYEEFRILHSRFLEILGKKEAVTVTISIHPLDYMTMSDNNNNWTSCMSWMENGCYRSGTLEMMNSNNTLVVYIKSKSKYTKICRNNEWNSKTWRMLTIFTKHAIFSGKQYPNSYDTAVEATLNKLKELAKENLGWEYQGNIESFNHDEDEQFSLSTFLMYNDFVQNYTYDHFYIVRRDLYNTKEYNFSYSGKIFCLECGKQITKTNQKKEREEVFLCKQCYNAKEKKDQYCDKCGDRDRGPFVILDNDSVIKKVCISCYRARYRDRNVKTDLFTGEEWLVRDMKKVYAIKNKKDLSDVLERWKFISETDHILFYLSPIQYQICKSKGIISHSSDVFTEIFTSEDDIVSYLKPIFLEENK